MTGTIFSANDISGIPSIEVLDTGLIKLGQYGGNVVLGSGTDAGKKLQVYVTTNTDGIAIKGGVGATNTSLILNNTGTGGNSWDISSTAGGHGLGDGKLLIGNSFSPKVTINGSGNVGIGTTSPGYLLHVESANANYSAVILNTLGEATGNGLFVQTRWNVASNYVARFTTNSGNTDVLAIKGDGNVGIGTVTPNEKLEVAGNIIIGSTNWLYGWNASSVRQPLIRSRGMGYAPTTYPGLQVGQTGDHIALFIDPNTIAGGSFNGSTNEIVIPNTMSILQGNSGSTDWIGCMTFSNGTVSFSNKITGNIDTAALAAETTAAFGRADVAAYPVCWIANNTNKSQMYSCAAVTIGSSTGTLNATTVNSANFCGAGGSTIYSTSSGVGYGAALQVREAGLSGAMASAAAYAPRLAFHWSGVVASSFSMGSDGHFYLNDNPGTGRESIHAKYYYADHSYGSGMIGLYDYTKYRMIYGMAGSYISNLDGTTTANHYGIGYAFQGYFGVPTDLGHCATFANAGTVQSAVGSAIWTSGNITAYSDERLKTNWRDLPKNFITELAKVKHGIYDRIDKGYEGLTQVGVSAQSLQPVMPFAIIHSNDEIDTLSVAYGNAAMVSVVELAKELVEQQGQIELLQQQVKSLLALVENK